MGLWSRLRRTFRDGRHNAEILEELRCHLDMDAAPGTSPRDARIRLGNVVRLTEETRSAGIVEWLDSLLRDMRYGLRQLRRAPVLMQAIVLSLAIGIGANTAIFSLIDAALLRPLPVSDADALRIIEWTNGGFPRTASNINGDFETLGPGRARGSSVSASHYRTLAAEQNGFASVLGIADAVSVAVVNSGSPAEQVSLQYVSENFFQTLGITPSPGRPFRAGEDRAAQPPVVIVSHRFWLNHLGGSTAVFDHDIRINNIPARIAGIAPPGFFGLQAGQWTDVYAPLAMRPAFNPRPGRPQGDDRHDWWVRQVGRLRPDTSEAAATARIATLFRNLVVSEDPTVTANQIPQLKTLPGRRGFNALNAKDSTALWVLMLLVAVLLLTVCANVANLLLSRSVGRQRESAVRLALGAAAGRLFRQHLIESAVLAILGGAAGLGLGYILARSIHMLFQTGRGVNAAFDLSLAPRLFAYTAGISIFTALIFGLAPAIFAARADLHDVLKSRARSVTGNGLRLPRLLVAIQIALCLSVLMAAGLLSRSFANLEQTDIGFDRQNLAFASVNPWQAGYSPDRVGPYLDRARQELSRIPGVVSVGVLGVRPVSGNGSVFRVSIPGRADQITPGVVTSAQASAVTEIGIGVLETLRIPLVAGRDFDSRDIHVKANTAIVDERFAGHFFPGQNALGRRIGTSPKESDRYEIIGIVRDNRIFTRSLRDPALPTIYLPFVPAESGAAHFAIRARIDSGRLAADVRSVLAAIDPNVPLTEFHTQTELIDRMLRTERMLGYLSSAFGIVVLALAGIGLAGLLAYAVARRTNEIGVRMALGASRGDVIRMVLRDSFWTVAGGLIIGLPGAWMIGRLLKTLLFRLEPLDPWIAGVSLLALVAIALLAAWIPAGRAANVEPLTALREE